MCHSRDLDILSQRQEMGWRFSSVASHSLIDHHSTQKLMTMEEMSSSMFLMT
jgi:hypothetical protein